jgi:hypothetical protein
MEMSRKASHGSFNVSDLEALLFQRLQAKPA